MPRFSSSFAVTVDPLFWKAGFMVYVTHSMFFSERRLYIRLISLIDSIVCPNSFRLEYFHVLPIEVLYLYDLTKLLYLLNLKTI
jgi:hypothetical protein